MASKIILLFIIAVTFLSNSQNKAQNISSSDKKIEIKNNDFENISGASTVINWQFLLIVLQPQLMEAFPNRDQTAF